MNRATLELNTSSVLPREGDQDLLECLNEKLFSFDPNKEFPLGDQDYTLLQEENSPLGDAKNLNKNREVKQPDDFSSSEERSETPSNNSERSIQSPMHAGAKRTSDELIKNQLKKAKISFQCNAYFSDGHRCTKQVTRKVSNVIQACGDCDDRIHGTARFYLCKNGQEELEKLSPEEWKNLIDQKVVEINNSYRDKQEREEKCSKCSVPGINEQGGEVLTFSKKIGKLFCKPCYKLEISHEKLKEMHERCWGYTKEGNRCENIQSLQWSGDLIGDKEICKNCYGSYNKEAIRGPNRKKKSVRELMVDIALARFELYKLKNSL